MLFGVRVSTEGSSSSFRKSASMNNLSQYDQLQDSNGADAGYASDDVVHASGRSRERKRGILFKLPISLFCVCFVHLDSLLY